MSWVKMIKNITLSAEEDLIDAAREIAKSEHKTLNAVFREWLEQYRLRISTATSYRETMKALSHVDSGGRFSRKEMNER
jgi:hypothetical protein